MKRPSTRLIIALLLTWFIFSFGPSFARAQEDEGEGEQDTGQEATAEQAPQRVVETGPSADPFFEHFAGVPTALAKTLEPIYFHHESIRGLDVIVPNPTIDIEQALIKLEKSDPKEPILKLYRSRLEVALGKPDEARAAMEEYVRLKKRDAESLAQYAGFLHSRLMYREEARVLEERAKSLAGGSEADKQDAKKDYERIVALIIDRRLSDLDPFSYYRKIIAMLPNDSAVAMDYIKALNDAGKTDEAIRESEKLSSRYPESKRDWLKLRVELYRKTKSDDKAVALYEGLDPLDAPDLYADYFALLSDLGRIGDYRRKLENARAAKEPADAKLFVAWFRLKVWSGELDAAEKGLQEWISKLETAGRLRDNLSFIGEMLLQSSRSGYAAPYFYSLYATSGDAAAREEALWGLYRSFTKGDDADTVFSSGVAPGRDLLELDNLPSVSGGVLSLLLASRDLAGKLKSLDKVSRIYRNRRMAARVVDEMRRAFPKSRRLTEMDWGIIDSAVVYKDWLVVESLARNFIKAHPTDARYFDAMFALAGSFTEREKFKEEGQVYRQILTEASQRKNGAAYQRAFDAYIASLTKQKRFLDVLSLYWEEIGRHPNDEKLYDAFLKFAGVHNLYDQELKAYQRAVSSFNDPSWYHKMARWYLKNKGEAAFRKITQDIRGRLDGSALGDYLGEFVSPDWENMNDAKSRFYLESYLYAHARFPMNLEFVRGLIKYYDNFNRRNGSYAKELEALRVQYFIFAVDIRDDLMRNWMRRDKLVELINALGAKQNRSISETFMLAWGRRWIGDHEGAQGPLADLVKIYPGSQQLVKEKASLDRSLAHSFYGDDAKKTESAIELYKRLAARYPQNTEYLTLAGEVLADGGNLKEATALWRKILDVGPGMPDVYKQLATLLWDYYQFDEAATVLEQIRAIRNNQYLFVNELAAVYESKGDYDKALNEYVKLHTLQRSAAAASLNRLVYLTEEKKMGAKIEQTYRVRIAAEPSNATPLLAFADYLRAVNEDKQALDLLASSLPHYGNKEFVEECVVAFSNAARYDLLEKALTRLLDISGGDYEVYGRLAAFYESRKQWQKAEDTYKKLVESSQSGEPKDRVKALNDLASFYWRRERYDEALARYRDAAMLAENEAQETLLHSLADRYIQRDKLGEATEILSKLIDQHPTNTTYFNTLAEVYRKKNDFDGLAALYKTGLGNVRKAPISADERKDLIVQLRDGLASSYAKAGRYTEALDQYIEIINLYPIDEARLDSVYRFADEHKLLDRLRDYYRKTAAEAGKNYRWQLVLARIDARRGDRDAARTEYRAALKLEPQLDWLYSELANLYLEDGKYDEVVAVYEEMARLSRDPHVWHLRIATALFRSGKRPEAIARAKKSIEGNPPVFDPYFDLADLFLAWNEPAQAEEALGLGIGRFKTDFYKKSLNTQNVRTITKIISRTKGFDKAYGELQSLREPLLSEVRKKQNFRREMVQNSLKAVYEGLSTILAQELRQRGADSDQRALTNIYKTWVAKDDEAEGVFDLALAFAREAGNPNLESDLYEGWLNRHRSDYDNKSKRSGYIAVEGRYEQFLKDRRNYAGLEKFYQGRPEPDRFYLKLSHIYLINDRSADEIAILGRDVSRLTGTTLGGFSGDNPEVHRYVQILLAAGREPQLSDLANSSNAFTGFYVNEFILQGRKDLALLAVNSGCKSKGDLWRRSKSALIYSYFNDTGGTARETFRGILGIESIEKAIARQGAQVLQDKDYVTYAWHYSQFLDKAGDAGYKRWLFALAEGSPRAEVSYLRTGDYQYERGRYPDALYMYRLAGELAPSSLDVIRDQARALYRMGKKKEALELLSKILDPKQPSSYVTYRDALDDLGEDGNDKLAAYLREIWPKDVGGSKEALSALMTAWVDEPARKEALLKNLVALRPNDLALPQTVIDEGWLKGPSLDYFYEALIAAIESGAPVNEPLRNEWRKKYSAHLITAEEYNKALALIAENARMEVIKDSEVPLARAEVYLRLNKMEEARAELRKSLGPDPVPFVRYDAVIALLISTGKTDEAVRWREEELKLKIAAYGAAADFAELAKILLKRGEKEPAIVLLERMIRLSPENPTGLRQAAELAKEFELYDNALAWRQRLSPLAPDDDSNRFEIAWLIGKKGNLREALSQSLALNDDPSVFNQTRYDMAKRLPKLLADDRNLLAQAISKVSLKIKNSGRESDYLLLANLYLKSGDENSYKMYLQSASQNLLRAPECSLAFARYLSEKGALDDAAKYYLTYLYQNPVEPAVFIELSELDLKRGKTRLAIDALPAKSYKDAITPEFGSDFDKINAAIAGRWSSIESQAEFLLRLSETAENLDWIYVAIDFARDTLKVVQSGESLAKTQTASATTRAERRGIFGKRIEKSPQSVKPSGMQARINERILALEKKKSAMIGKKNKTLHITAEMEN